MDCAVIGFDISGDPLLDGGPILLRDGMTVVYGGNGAGKSRLLRGIRGALRGVVSDVNVTLIVEAQRPAADAGEDDTHWSFRDRQRPILVALAQAIASDEDVQPSYPGVPVAERAISLPRASAIVDNYISWTAGDFDPPLLAELLETRLFLLSPTGSEDTPSWDAWPVADAGLPEAMRVDAELNERYMAVDAVPEDEYDEALAAYQEWALKVPLMQSDGAELEPRRSARWLRPRAYTPYSSGVLSTIGPFGVEVLGPVDFGIDFIDFGRDAAAATNDYVASIVALMLDVNDLVRSDKPSGASSLAPRFGLGETSSRLWSWERRRRGPYPLHEGTKAIARKTERAATKAAQYLSEHVTRTLQSVLLDPPVARLDIADPALRLARTAAAWRFARSGGAVEVDLNGLSHAERLWAERAILEALYWHQRERLIPPDDPLRPALYILDEPEAALHRAAEAHMAERILDSATDPRKAFLIATHSPELLDSPTAHVIEVQRNGVGNRSLVHDLDLTDRDALEGLGLTPSDLLRWQRVFLLVEGEHDEVLLRHFLGPRLRAARVEIIPLRGAKNLAHAIDSRVLFDFTRAHMVALVDNARAQVLHDAWIQAQATALTDVEGAIETLVATIGQETDEAKVVNQWLTGSLRKGVADRVSAQALEKQDIIHYLPVDRFVASASSWEDLLAEHAHRRATTAGTPREFKPWLRIERKADVGIANILAAAAGVDVPDDFEQLMRRLEALSADPTS